MTTIWAWADLGDNCLEKYNIKQYWLLMSVLSVKKFNPEFKRIFFVDKKTYSFLNERKWVELWDEVKIIDYADTEYGNLYNNHIYAWPKIYSYGLIDDDIIILDIDIVFTKPFVIHDLNKIHGKVYNHVNYFSVKNTKTHIRHKWPYIDMIQNQLYDDDIIDNKMEQDTICLQGSPIYCPRKYTKILRDYLMDNIQNVETYFNGLAPFDTFQSIEEEFPLSQFARMNGGIGILDTNMYRHGYTYMGKFNITEGFEKPEKILGINVYDDYLKKYEQNYPKLLQQNM